MKSLNEASVCRKFRLNNEYSQWGIAKILGYKQPQIISNIERGLQGFPVSSLKMIRNKFGRDFAHDLIDAKVSDYENLLVEIIAIKKKGKK